MNLVHRMTVKGSFCSLLFRYAASEGTMRILFWLALPEASK